MFHVGRISNGINQWTKWINFLMSRQIRLYFIFELIYIAAASLNMSEMEIITPKLQVTYRRTLSVWYKQSRLSVVRRLKRVYVYLCIYQLAHSVNGIRATDLRRLEVKYIENIKYRFICGIFWISFY